MKKSDLIQLRKLLNNTILDYYLFNSNFDNIVETLNDFCLENFKVDFNSIESILKENKIKNENKLPKTFFKSLKSEIKELKNILFYYYL